MKRLPMIHGNAALLQSCLFAEHTRGKESKSYQHRQRECAIELRNIHGLIEGPHPSNPIKVLQMHPSEALRQA
jgi:hypothetical protein